MVSKNELINKIIGSMARELDSLQLSQLETVLRIELHGVVLQEECTELSTYSDDNEYMLQIFAANKKLENLSDKSIKQYVDSARKLFNTLDKNYKDITTDDIKYYLAQYKMVKKVSACTLASMKRFLSAFFSWALDEEYINRNPVHAIKNIKQPTKPKEYLNSKEVEQMRDHCCSFRERAILEFLLDTGCRVSEVAALNRDSVNMHTGEVKIYATKTSKWRTGYLNSRALLHLQKYLNSRSDKGEALFVTERKPNRRLENGSYQTELQNIAKRAGVKKHVTVHLLRKTFATNLSASGTPIEVIKELLGHANISVTEKNYVTINQDEIKNYHRKIA